MMNQMNQYSPTSQQSTYNQRPDQAQQQFQSEENQRLPNTTSIRRNSRVLSPQDRPTQSGIGQTLNDRSDHLTMFSSLSLKCISVVTMFLFFRLDHYKRPPSRDSSVDRYRRHPLVSGSRQASIDKMPSSPTPDIPDK